MRFIVLRHAESEWNRSGIIQGRSDSPLTEEGRRQIAGLGARLQMLSVTLLISSPAGRAFTTAETLAERCGCTVQMDERLQEQDFGRLEGLSYAQAMRDYPEATQCLFAGKAEASAPGGENAYEVAWRLMACLSDLAVDGQNQTLGVVTHGHALQALIWWLKGADPQEDLRRYGHRNCGYAMLDVTASGFNLLNWGVATHLLPQR
ncbi:histidine phosphatase family protein [Serratia sp. RJAL6]|uniref:histidine phosphatase family protein n=1 Tax=Serratia marcescens TaxID=615 RepID=UPI0011F19072|nr:histidine phosphatase family protein [Serratia marcescens]KAB5495156.1 histidine phosphatase family protein [Enterobacter sp. RJAL6]